jgi:hypothetical protein
MRRLSAVLKGVTEGMDDEGDEGEDEGTCPVTGEPWACEAREESGGEACEGCEGPDAEAEDEEEDEGMDAADASEAVGHWAGALIEAAKRQKKGAALRAVHATIARRKAMGEAIFGRTDVLLEKITSAQLDAANKLAPYILAGGKNALLADSRLNTLRKRLVFIGGKDPAWGLARISRGNLYQEILGKIAAQAVQKGKPVSPAAAEQIVAKVLDAGATTGIVAKKKTQAVVLDHDEPELWAEAGRILAGIVNTALEGLRAAGATGEAKPVGEASDRDRMNAESLQKLGAQVLKPVTLLVQLMPELVDRRSEMAPQVADVVYKSAREIERLHEALTAIKAGHALREGVQ